MHGVSVTDSLAKPMTTLHKRQTGIYDPASDPHAAVTVIGAGNIGSHTTLALARMGIAHLEVFDADIVELHNLASQAYNVTDIDKPKVLALGEQVAAVAPDGCDYTAHNEWYTDQVTNTIVVVAVDSLAERRAIGENLRGRCVHIIDGRMGGGQLEVHNPVDVDEWLRSMPAEADADPCSARYISYTSYIIAGVIANVVKQVRMGEPTIRRYIHDTVTNQTITEYAR